MLTGKNQIGDHLSSNGEISFHTFNPKLNKENSTIFYEASSEEINKAVSLASTAYIIYSKISPYRKADFLDAIADEIMSLGQELIDTYCIESGLPEKRAINERERTVRQLQMFAKYVRDGSWVEATIDLAQPERKPVPKPDIRKMLVPLGPVVVFGASNFPLAYSTAGGDTASALAAGCPVIVKSHPMHAGTGELIAFAVNKAAIKTKMPNGVFSNLNSSGISVGKELVKHLGVKAVGFTGSVRGGRALFDIASQRLEPIPVFAEMGSINPTIVLPNALKMRADSIAITYAKAITLGTGQFCTNPGLIIGIRSKELDRFIVKLSNEIMQVEPCCMLHPNIIGNYEKGKENAQNQKGVTISVDFLGDTPTNHARQTILTVEGHTFLENKTLHHEVFGPFSIVVKCADIEELETIVNNLEGQLTGTIHAEENEITKNISVIQALENRVGRIIFNGVSNGVEVCAAMQHGGPYPASTDSRFTAVGVQSIKRWARPISYQNWPDSLLPIELRDDNPMGITRKVF